jgi:hypothetical protein
MSQPSPVRAGSSLHLPVRRLPGALRASLSVAVGGVLMALAMIYGCSSESVSKPPPGGGDCVGHCGAILSSGGSQAGTGATVDQNDAAGDAGVFADVNPNDFDGNLPTM